MSDTPDTSHVHGFLCQESVEHASTPLYDETAWDHSLAPLPAEQVA